MLGSDETSPKSRAVLGRLLRYVLHYPYRVGGGILLATIVSLSNLLSLTSFVPIFNTMGKETNPEIFDLSINDYMRATCYHKRTGIHLEPNYRLEIDAYIQKLNLEAARTSFCEDYDLPPVQHGTELCACYGTDTSTRFRTKLTAFKFSTNSQVKDKSPGQAILYICSILLPVYLLKMIGLIGAVYCMGTAGLSAVRDLRKELYDQLNRLGLDFFGKEKTGEIMSRISNDAEIVGRTLSVEFNESLVNIFYIITHLPVLIIINWQLFLITLIIGPLVIGPVSNFAVKIRKAFTNQQQRLAELSGHIQEIMSGIRVIRAFGMENFELKRFQGINERLYQNTFKGHYYHQVGPAITDLMAGMVVIGFLAYGSYAMTEGEMNKGTFMTFFFVLLFVMRPIKQISVMTNLLSAATAAGARIFEILDLKTEVVEKRNAKDFNDLQNAICYKNVSYRYADTNADALSNININIPRGATVALVGASGAGKSTMMDLLPRFYDVSTGSITLDGTDIRDIKLKDLRTAIGIVGQDVFLFNASIRENIAYGRADIADSEIQTAARNANAHEFIQNLPEKYDTAIGERGVMLSGGQRQRIAIARALLLDPPILILDEATSNLDNESEKLVQEALDRLLTGRTVFVIAHRLSTIYRSDTILVLDRARIVEKGTHQELLEVGGVYKKLYDMQFSEHRDV